MSGSAAAILDNIQLVQETLSEAINIAPLSDRFMLAVEVSQLREGKSLNGWID